MNTTETSEQIKEVIKKYPIIIGGMLFIFNFSFVVLFTKAFPFGNHLFLPIFFIVPIIYITYATKLCRKSYVWWIVRWIFLMAIQALIILVAGLTPLWYEMEPFFRAMGK